MSDADQPRARPQKMPPPRSADAEKRLANALRANLKRRRAQKSAREGSDAEPPPFDSATREPRDD